MQAANKFKVTGDTLSSLLCIYLKRMQEVQPLILTGLQDNWIKDDSAQFKVFICTCGTQTASTKVTNGL